MMLVYPPCIDFILIFISCLRAGIVAVPVYPPSMSYSACLLSRPIGNQEECPSLLWDPAQLPSEDRFVQRVLIHSSVDLKLLSEGEAFDRHEVFFHPNGRGMARPGVDQHGLHRSRQESSRCAGW